MAWYQKLDETPRHEAATRADKLSAFNSLLI